MSYYVTCFIRSLLSRNFIPKIDNDNKTNRVLQHVERVLLQRGYHVLRYNSRGVGKSSGWPSLNGLQEGQDLQEVVRWALDHMTSVTSVIITVRTPFHFHSSFITVLTKLLFKGLFSWCTRRITVPAPS